MKSESYLWLLWGMLVVAGFAATCVGSAVALAVVMATFAVQIAAIIVAAIVASSSGAR